MDYVNAFFELLNFLALCIYIAFCITVCIRVAFRAYCSACANANISRRFIPEDGTDEEDDSEAIERSVAEPGFASSRDSLQDWVEEADEDFLAAAAIGLKIDSVPCSEHVSEALEKDEAELRFAALREGDRDPKDNAGEDCLSAAIDPKGDATVAQRMDDILETLDRDEAELGFAALRESRQDLAQETDEVDIPEVDVIEEAGDISVGSEDATIETDRRKEVGSVGSFTPPTLGRAGKRRVRHKRLRAIGRDIRFLCGYFCCFCKPVRHR